MAEIFIHRVVANLLNQFSDFMENHSSSLPENPINPVRAHITARSLFILSRSALGWRFGVSRANDPRIGEQGGGIMGTATLTLAYLLMAAGANPDVWPINQSNIRIPIHIDPIRRPLIKQLVLYSSSDEGKTWKQVAVASPDQDSFTFSAPTDGVYWFSVIVVDPQGNQEPKDIYKVPPSQKILVDTLKPIVKITALERQGEDIVVNWEIQEDHPDLSTLKLEYKTADAPSSVWYTAPLNNPPLIGQAKFRMTSTGAVSVRVQMQDTAGNMGFGTRELTATASAVAPPASPSTSPAYSNPPSIPSAASGTSPWDTNRSAQTTSMTRTDSLPASSGYQQPSNGYQQPSSTYQQPASSYQAPGSGYQQPAWNSNQQPVSNYQQPLPAPGAELSNRLVASSETSRGVNTPAFSVSGGQGPPVIYSKEKVISINYEVDKVGPSGLGRVDLWMTQDDGRTWRWHAGDTPTMPPTPMNVELPGEGVYGFRIVVQSKAGLGKRGPVSGDSPEMRVELDMTPPVAQLYAPEPDPHQHNALTITWNATDKNLTTNPISLQWAERRDGEWHEIASGLANSGRFSWLLAPNLPFKVYMRLIVRDLAGNVSTAETAEPVLVDLSEPEGRITGLAQPIRRQ
jgi:hypothetical protein